MIIDTHCRLQNLHFRNLTGMFVSPDVGFTFETLMSFNLKRLKDASSLETALTYSAG